jgi:hypothetical protein
MSGGRDRRPRGPNRLQALLRGLARARVHGVCSLPLAAVEALGRRKRAARPDHLSSLSDKCPPRIQRGRPPGCMESPSPGVSIGGCRPSRLRRGPCTRLWVRARRGRGLSKAASVRWLGAGAARLRRRNAGRSKRPSCAAPCSALRHTRASTYPSETEVP